MSSLNQYLQLYRDNRKLIDANSASALNAHRREAEELLSQCVVPDRKCEGYRHIDLPALLAPDYGLNLNRVGFNANPTNSFRCGVPSVSTSLFMTINDIPAETEATRDGLPQGVLAGSLRSIALRHPEVIDGRYAALASKANPLVLLNNLLCQDGFCLYVPKGVKVERPLQLVDIFQAEMPLMAVRRILIIMEEDTEAQLLLCDHTQRADQKYLSLQTVEIFAGKGSRLDVYDLEESTPQTTRLSSLYLSQEEGSRVLLDGITLHNGTTRNEYFCDFTGENAELRLLGMGIENGDSLLDTYSIVNHNRPRCKTEELFKYVVDDRARGVFSGRIYVAPGAVKTEAYQSNRNVVGSGEARMYSDPQLEIYNDDVKCSHGCAIGRLDETQLFYLRTRGIEEKDAKLMLKQAFMADVIDAVRMAGLKERLQLLVERCFAGEGAGCATCALC